MELKIEQYNSQNEAYDEGKNIGSVKMNLSEYIGKGLKCLTFKINDFLFLTVNLTVVMTEKKLDAVDITLQAAKKANEEDSSESEQEQDVCDVINTYKHVSGVSIANSASTNKLPRLVESPD